MLIDHSERDRETETETKTETEAETETETVQAEWTIGQEVNKKNESDAKR